MSAALLVECRGCGHEFAVRVQPLGQQPTANSQTHAASEPRAQASGQGAGSSGQGERAIDVEYSDDDGWQVNCPKHGWHAAREFPASNEAGAVIKCTGKTAGKWCELRVPLELARRRAGVTGR
jgi:hypothetical protein